MIIIFIHQFNTVLNNYNKIIFSILFLDLFPFQIIHINYLILMLSLIKQPQQDFLNHDLLQLIHYPYINLIFPVKIFLFYLLFQLMKLYNFFNVSIYMEILRYHMFNDDDYILILLILRVDYFVILYFKNYLYINKVFNLKIKDYQSY